MESGPLEQPGLTPKQESVPDQEAALLASIAKLEQELAKMQTELAAINEEIEKERELARTERKQAFQERASVAGKKAFDAGKKAAKVAAVAGFIASVPEEIARDPLTRAHEHKQAERKATERIDTSLFLSEHFKQLENKKIPEKAQDSTRKEAEPVLPARYGALEKHMNMEFFNSALTSPALKLQYLRWIRDCLENKKMHPYDLYAEKDKALLYVVDRNGNPVGITAHGKPVIIGREYGDGIDEGKTPAGTFEIRKSTDPLFLKQHQEPFEILVPSPDGTSLDIQMHDTLYHLESRLQSDALRSSSPQARRRSNGCIRVAGLDNGVFNDYLKPVPIKQTDASGQETITFLLPKINISPEEKVRGKIRIIDASTGLTKDITPAEYDREVQRVIESIK